MKQKVAKALSLTGNIWIGFVITIGLIFAVNMLFVKNTEVTLGSLLRFLVIWFLISLPGIILIIFSRNKRNSEGEAVMKEQSVK